MIKLIFYILYFNILNIKIILKYYINNKKKSYFNNLINFINNNSNYKSF